MRPASHSGWSEKEIDMTKEFFSPATLPPPAGYSHIAKVNKGTLIYLAGQVSSDASGALVGEGNFEAQAERVYANVKIAVEAAGATMADIVKLNTYIVAAVDPAEVPKMRAIRNRYVNTEKPPASTLVVVTRLAQPGWLIEVEAVAAIDA
jgi:enamine deaminase RidA (YjgF/YER057c/UK114 family)